MVDRVRARRALPGLLVVLAVVLAACGPGGNPAVAATVGDEDIPVPAVEERFEAIRANPQFAQQVAEDEDGTFTAEVQASLLGDLIETTIVRQAAAEIDITVSDAEVEARTEEIVEELGRDRFDELVEESGMSEEDIHGQIRDLLLRERLSERLTGDVAITDEEVERYYEEQRETRYERASARHILVETEEEAQAVLERLEAGEDFADVAADVSIDPGSAERGGDLGEFGPQDMVPAFAEAVFSAEEGEVVGPVETDFGFHVIEVTGKSSQGLEEVAEELRGELGEQRRTAVMEEWLRDRLREADVTVNPRFGSWDAERGRVVAVDEAGATAAPAGGTPPADE